MEKVSKIQSFASKVFSIEKVNPFFSKVKIYVMYEGINRKGFYLSREAINKAIPTLFNTPIVGEFLADEKNFGGHGASVVKSNEGNPELVLSTRPYGVIPESAQIYWEAVTEDDGSLRDYLVVDGAYLWSGRYPELQTILDEGYFGQSMEIQVANGQPSIKSGTEVFDIQDFVFTGFCLLGIDKESDMYGHVEPAFEKAKVELVTYSLDKDSFKNQFNQMIDELKFTLQEGANTMANTEAQEDLKNRLGGVPTTDTEPEKVEPETNTEPETDGDGDTGTAEGSQEATEGSQEGDTPQGGQVEGQTETQPTDGVEATTEGATDGDGGEATFSVSVEEHNTLKANFEALETELTDLRNYKRTRELGDLQGRFSSQISEKEITAIFEANLETPIEKLELEIFALIGKKNFSLDSKQEQNKVSVVSPKVSNQEANPYGDIFK